MRSTRPARATLLVTVALFGSAACSSGGGTTDPPTQPAAVARLQVSVDTVRLTIGRATQVTAHAVDASGATLSAVPIMYGVRNAAVASVSTSGMVGGSRLGTTTLRVSAGAAAADVPVVVSFDSASYTRRPLDGGPFGIALGGDVLVVTQKDVGTVAVGGLAGAPLSGGIEVGAIPTDVSVNTAGTEAYVTNQYSQTLGIVNVGTRQQVATVPIPADPYRSVLTRDEKRVWVTTNGGGIYAVDVATRRVIDSLPGVGATNGFAIAPGDTLAYASNYNGEVREFDLRTHRVTRTFSAPGLLQEVVVSGDGKELYVGNEGGFIEVFDLTAGTPTPVIRLGVGQVFGMALGPDGNTLFVARTLDGAVAAIDRTTRKTLFSHPIGGLPRRVKFAASGTAIVVANEAGWVDVLR